MSSFYFAPGQSGSAGEGIAAGGTTGQALVKASDTDFDTEWTSLELGGLGDVDVTTAPPADGEALVWDEAAGEWVPGSAGATAAGNANEIQYNDGASGLAASADLTWDDTAKELGVGGDINLDDGGASTTTVQCVTPTQDRTISFPDATGTVALVAGSNQAVQYNSAGANAGDSGLLYNATSGSLTVGGKTVTTDAPVINLSQTWNSAGTTFTGLKLNVTTTASAAASNLLDLQANGTSRFSVGSGGGLKYGTANFGLGFPSGYANILDYDGNVIISWQRKTTNIGVNLVSTRLSWGTDYFSSDISLERDAANVLAQRNGTNAQTFRLYNTWANSGVDFERGFLKWDSNVFEIGTEKAGTGAARNLKLSGPSASSSLTFSSAGISTADHVTLSSAFRAGGNTNVAINGTYQLAFTSTSTITSSVDAGFTRDSAGVVKVTDGSTGTGYVKQVPVAISALPAAGTVGAGTRGFVNDASSTTFAAQVAVGTNDGGSTVVPVYSDGSTWRIG